MSLLADKTAARRVTLCGMLTALAFALAFLEHLLPIQAVIPVPGIKLGLANIVTLFALGFLDKRYAVCIVVVRCLLQNVLFGSVSALLFSLSGGLLALFCMAVLFHGYGSWFSLFGISVAGAACHNLGQVLCAMVYFQSAAILSYLPVLLALSIPMGLLTGLVGTVTFPHLRQFSSKFTF